MKSHPGVGAPPGQAGSWRAVTRVLRSCAESARTLTNDHVTTIFPADCRVCDGPLTAWSSTPVCEACLSQVTPQQDSLCETCGEALGMESARFAAALGESRCTACRLAPPEFSRAVAYAAYDDELRELLHLFKYERMQRLAEGDLGQWLAQAILSLRPEAASELTVIAVPLFGERERRRGFNQSVVLASGAMRFLKKLQPAWALTAAHTALKRTRDTEAQFALQPRARRRNLRGAFKVEDPAAIRGREILLIDDIMTTGATARECARVLVLAGATKVWVATVARAQPESFSAATEPSAAAVARWDVEVQGPNPERRMTF